MGESILLSDGENRRIAEIVSDQNRGRVKNIMHVGAPTTERTVALARHAASVGVKAICCVPPFFYRRTDEEIVQHYRAVGDAAGLPLFAYNLPSATSMEITPALIEKIQNAVRWMVGLKHSATDQMHIRTFERMGLVCFTGNSRMVLPALTIGAVGCVDGPLNVAPNCGWRYTHMQAVDFEKLRLRRSRPGILWIACYRSVEPTTPWLMPHWEYVWVLSAATRGLLPLC